MVSVDRFQELKKRLEDRTAQVGILGLGYVGIPLARAFCKAGFRVHGFDVDTERCALLNRGESPILHIPAADLAGLVQSGVFVATTEFKLLRRMDVAIICVPTPLTTARDPDLSYVRDATTSIRRYMNPGMLVVLESTTYPGTTEEVVRPILEESGLDCGVDFFLAFSPEREDPGNREYSTSTIPKLVGGVDSRSGELARQLYSSVVEEVMEVKDARTAEAAKVLENIYRAVNIALVNELKVLFDRMDIDVWAVIEAASTKPFGFQAFFPGPGLGGHCIPIDPFYLTWRARQYDLRTRFIELAGEINTAMPEFVISKLGDALNSRGKPLRGSKILMLGVAYKRDVEDTRESPAFRLLTLLSQKGAEVRYHDPYVPFLKPQHGFQLALESVALTPEFVAEMDAVLVVTHHSCIDYAELHKHAQLVVDTRNALGGIPDPEHKVVRA
ncbi:MAG: nucleotide sugar dehydrogenase [Planctomycetota bacterium]